MGNMFHKTNSKSSNSQQSTQTDILNRIPSHIMTDVLSFLTLKQRINISTVSKNFRTHKPQSIMDVVETVVQNKRDANILYHQINVEHNKQFDGDYLNLIGVEFRFLTKDQGWASVSTSSSWIQAQLIDQKQLQYTQVQHKRYTLVENFKQKDYKIKTKTCDLTSFKNLAKIKIYLRSMFPGWQISCKKSEVRLIYA